MQSTYYSYYSYYISFSDLSIFYVSFYHILQLDRGSTLHLVDKMRIEKGGYDTVEEIQTFHSTIISAFRTSKTKDIAGSATDYTVPQV